MKKLFYIIAISFACSLTITACTDEEVTPAVSRPAGGADSADPF